MNLEAENSQMLPAALCLKNMWLSSSINFSSVSDLWMKFVFKKFCLFQYKPSCSFFILHLHKQYWFVYFLSLVFSVNIVKY